MSAEGLTVVCAWCQQTITAATAGALVTHTICQPCFDRTARPDDDASPDAINPPADYFGDVFKH